MKRFASLSLFLLFASLSNGQTVAPPAKDYYVGVGEDASLEKARSLAYANMVEQIQVLVSSSFQTRTRETNGKIDQSAQQSTVSFSSILLRDVQETVTKTGDIFRVTKYVSKEAVRSMFAMRRQQIIDHCAAAEAALNTTSNIDLQSAFDHYYKAWLLAWLYPDTLSYSFRLVGMSVVSTGIERAMTAAAEKIVFAPLRKLDDELTTWKYTALWSGQPISRLRYSFFDGLGQSEDAVRNGAAQLTFFFADKRERQIQLKIEYRSSEGFEGLLAVADSIRSGSAPTLTFTALLPGEKVDQPPATGKPAPTGVEAVKAVAPEKLPAPLQQLLAHRKALPEFLETLEKLSKRGEIIAGSRKDFDNLNGLYVIVLDGTGIVAILRHTDGKYLNADTGDEIRLPDFAGKRILWVRVQ